MMVHTSHLRILIVAAIAFAPVLSPVQGLAQEAGSGDAPNRVARVAYTQGNVSLETAGVDSFSAAELNYPLTNGDRIFADPSSLAELQTSGLAIRLANGADLTVSTLSDSVAQFGLAQGSIRVRTRDLYVASGYDGQPRQAVVEIDTPNGAILLRQAGDLRVDSYPQDDTTVVTVSSGQAEVSGQGFDQIIERGQALRLAGSNPTYVEAVGLLPPDNLDNFDKAREREREQSASYRNRYVDPEMIGAAELDQYGDWQRDSSYGTVWYPRQVAYDWTPYSAGHWAWIAPWGWTWIESEPWGFAPFHYGRWNNFGGRWGWVPGPPPDVLRDGFGGRAPRCVYSPALVAFVGGANFSISIGFGGGSGAGVTAWFPLGPQEAYTPWYQASPAYVNRVNVTNIYNTNVTEIHNTYINQTTNVYNTTNVTYVNRNVATVAVQQRDFAAGRSVAQSIPIRLDANVRRQLAQAPILPHPLVSPLRTAAAPQAPARALPPTVARPVVETRQGFQRAGAPAGSAPVAAPANQLQRPMANQPRQPVNQPKPQVNPPQQPVNRAAFPQQRPVQLAPGGQVPPRSTMQPATGGNVHLNQTEPTQTQPGQLAPPSQPRSTMLPATGDVVHLNQQPPAQTRQAPPQQPQPFTAQPARNQPIQNQPNRPNGREAMPPQPFQSQSQPQPRSVPMPTPRPVEQPRPIVTVNPPQPPPPSFADQRRVIQQKDPGRPLAPQQLDNLRNGRPAGPQGQPEAVAHPAPIARPAPPPVPQPSQQLTLRPAPLAAQRPAPQTAPHPQPGPPPPKDNRQDNKQDNKPK